MATGGAPELRGSVSEGPGRPPALVPGPGRAGTSFHPHFPLRDSVSRCEKTPGSTLPSLPRYAGVRSARHPLSPQGLHIQVREDPAAPRSVCLPSLRASPPAPPRGQSLAPPPGHRGPAGTPGIGSGIRSTHGVGFSLPGCSGQRVSGEKTAGVTVTILPPARLPYKLS